LFGDYFQNIQLNFTSTTILLESTGTFTNGVEYTVSFFVLLNTGSLEQISVSLAGGNTEDFNEFSSTEFTRLSAKVTAGVSGNLKFTLISANLTAQPLIMGIQVETGDLSSYVRNGATLNTRPEDDVSATYSLPRPDESWSCMFNHNLISNDAADKYVFNNGLSGTDEFSCVINDDQLTVNIGSVLSIFNTILDSETIAMTYDGTDILLYKDGLFHQTRPNGGVVSAISSVIYIGGDETTGNSISAYMSVINFWDSEFTSDEIRYLAGA